MFNRMFKHIALAGVAAAVTLHAQTCNEIKLYTGNENNGQMEGSTRTFPEAPEWRANWGDFESMKAPYIRLSGQKSSTGDWTGALKFSQLPVTVQSGSLKLSVRSTQNVKFGVWLAGSSGNSKISQHSLTGGKTLALDIPLSSLGSGSFTIEKIGIGLFNVPAYQYITLFVDNVSLCLSKVSSSSSAASSVKNPSSSSEMGYSFASVTPNRAERIPLFESKRVGTASLARSTRERDSLKAITASPFVISSEEHHQILAYKDAQSLTPAESRQGWSKSLHILSRNRLQDSLVANPADLYFTANALAAAYGYQTFPILVADLDYAYAICSDSTCAKNELKDDHLLLSALPAAHITGSTIQLVYDPYFVVTTRTELPTLNICFQSQCKQLTPRNAATFTFPEAGVQTLTLETKSKNRTTKQTLSLEVR